MHTKIKLFVALSALFLTMCTFYDQGGPVVSSNGLSCQNHIDFAFFEWQQSAYCFYQCPDGTVREPEIPGKFSSSALYAASKEDVDAQFCNISPQPTPAQPPAMSRSTPPPVTMSPNALISSTALLTERAVTLPPVVAISTIGQVSLSPAAGVQSALLTGEVSMCDLAVRLINFRMVKPAPDFTGKALAVEIADKENACAVNPLNTSLLTCAIPARVTFPARVVVRVNSAVVNDFTYNGRWCAYIATPLPTVTP